MEERKTTRRELGDDMKYLGLTIIASLLLTACVGKRTIEIGTYSEPREPQVVSVPEEVQTTVPEEIVEEVIAPQKGNISAIDAYDMIQTEPELMILDVRNQNEIAIDGKISNSVLIPLRALKYYLTKLDKNKKILVYCHTGNRSLTATDMLFQNGFNAVNLLGGITDWKANHLPVRYK